MAISKSENEKSRDKTGEESKAVSPAELSYALAYVTMPHYAYSDPEKIAELWRETPDSAGAFLYFMTCQTRETKPDEENARLYSAYLAENKTHSFYLLQHPEPDPVDFSGKVRDPSLEAGRKPILAPWFSCVVSEKDGDESAIYILGQSPIGGGTTLRRVVSDGSNANLGPGPEPDSEKFLASVVKAMRAER